MLHDFILLLGWWLAIGLIGLMVLPLTKIIFHKFFDYGYPFSKIIGIGIFSYVFWLLSSLHIISFRQSNIILVIILATGLIFILTKSWQNFIKNYRFKWKIFLIEEIMFIGTLIFWAFIRGHHPDIQDLEKFMDFGFVNSILRSQYMPPLDMWSAGQTINYYYFGHYITAFLTKLINYDSAISYNLMLSTIFALSFTQTFSLGANLLYLHGSRAWEKITFAGLISAILINFGGNLHTLIYAYILPGLQKVKLFHGHVGDYWYADATRYIGYNPPTNDKTIHEFPSYSFVVADLHGHLLDLPIVLTILAILLCLFLSIALKVKLDKSKNLIAKLILYALLCLFLAIAIMTNMWDFPIYLLATGIILLVGYRISAPIDRTLVSSFFTIIGIALVAIGLSFPFIRNFHNMSQGIHLVSHRTFIFQWLVLWGYQLLLLILLIIFLIFSRQRKKFTHTFKAIRFFFQKIHPLDYFVLALGLTALILVLLPEIIFVKDIYFNGYPRANTMFKLTYGGFVIFGVISGYIIMRIYDYQRSRLKQILVNAGLLLVVITPLLFAYWAIPGYYREGYSTLWKVKYYQSLNGLKFLQTKYPDNLRAINWLNKNVSGQPVVLEANGDSYTDYNQISMATGLPTIQGWLVHEWLWRGNYEQPASRGDDVSAIYQSTDLTKVKKLLKKYQVKYIVIGPMEKEKFAAIQEDQLINLGRVVFNAQQTKIIQIK